MEAAGPASAPSGRRRRAGTAAAHGLSRHPRCVCVRICVSTCVRVFAWSPRLSLQSGQVSGWSHPAALPSVPPSFLHPFPRLWRLSSRLETRISRSCPWLGCRVWGPAGASGSGQTGSLASCVGRRAFRARRQPSRKGVFTCTQAAHRPPPGGEGPAQRSAPRGAGLPGAELGGQLRVFRPASPART